MVIPKAMLLLMTLFVGRAICVVQSSNFRRYTCAKSSTLKTAITSLSFTPARSKLSCLTKHVDTPGVVLVQSQESRVQCGHLTSKTVPNSATVDCSDPHADVNLFVRVSPQGSSEDLSQGTTLIQRRINGSVDFYREWNDYEEGFGDPQAEFWLGLKHIRDIVKDKNHEIWFNFTFEGDDYYATYSHFSIADAADYYRLSISGYSGNAGDGMKANNGYQFSTKDKDNDQYGSGQCAQLTGGAWWYGTDCGDVNLNGVYGRDGFVQSLYWQNTTGVTKGWAVTAVEIMIRQV